MDIEYIQQLKEQLQSFVEAMATAIDERTPYNGNHTRKVAEYSVKIAEKINEKNKLNEIDEFFDDERIEKLKLAALSHDIGKMVISKSIMNRSSRMCGDMPRIQMRFELLTSLYENDYLKNKISEKEYHAKIDELKGIIEFIEQNDGVEYLSDENFLKAQRLRNKVYVKEDGQRIPYLTDEEISHLSIRQGTLTEKERNIMKGHVIMTSKILDKVEFSEQYKEVPVWAAQHHEFLDGSGYPNGLTAKELPLESRILTVADIYDALTALDRPYKKPIKHDDSIDIMLGMASAGKIDVRLVKWLDEAISEKNC